MLVSASKFYLVLLTFAVISYVTSKVIPFYNLNSQILDHHLVPPQSYKEDEGECKPDCDSKIFCSGEILHDVQLSNIYPDSKSFVDAKLKFSEAEIVQKYQALKKQSNGQLSRDQITQFVNDNFYNPEAPQHTGLDGWFPPDFQSNPSIVENIRDEKYKKFARNLNEIWKNLSVKVNPDVLQHPDRYSLIYLPNGFIKAGGRFREMYYWDMYWVIRGLLICDMRDTVRGILENMIYLVKRFGFMPNGSRWYYTQRSQPPLMIQMAASYHSVTHDDGFIRQNLQYFEKEFQFWYTKRMVIVRKDGHEYKMFRYNATSCSPRPESYREDFNNSKDVPEAEKKRFFTGIRSGAESGWDFSTRHIRAPDNSNNAPLQFIDTQSFIYVDLNCILHANAVVLSEWYRYFGNEVVANKYKILADHLQDAIENVLWNEEAGIWLDYDLKTGRSRNYFYPSNLTPLWTRSYRSSKTNRLAEKAIVYLLKNGIINSDLSARFWGVPTSLNNSGEQWDFPNAWAPLQAIVIQGLERTGHPVAGYIAFSMAKNWINTTHTSYQNVNVMFEKYSAVEFASFGGGGEYKVQDGFGWTNGFIFELLHTYGQFLDSRSM